MEMNLFKKGSQNPTKMEMNILKTEKEEMELQFDNLTLAEILRVYLNKDSAVTFAAWRRDHPTEKPVLKVKTKGKTAKKAVSDAVSAVEKDLEKVLNDFKKMK
jgi:DNA-directed RNA polymerase subunit L